MYSGRIIFDDKVHDCIIITGIVHEVNIVGVENKYALVFHFADVLKISLLYFMKVYILYFQFI